MSTLLFVYGTLKRGCCNHAHLAGQRFVGRVVEHLLQDVQGVVGAGVHARTLLDGL